MSVANRELPVDFFVEHTLEEVATHLGVTRERVRQIEAKALRKLRHPTGQYPGSAAARQGE